MMTAPFEQAPALAGIPGLKHAFFGRQGGVSSGEFAGNNMSLTVGDDEDNVIRNRADAATQLGFAATALCLLRQVHSNTVVTVDAPTSPQPLVDADAMVTTTPGLVLGILTADCTPILLADREAGVIGAAHAGWRGAVDGICGTTIDAMVALGAERTRIVAAIGPTIYPENYEVGAQFERDFLALHPGGAHHFSVPAGGQPHFDLPGFVVEQLRGAGVATVERAGACTYAHADRYFSHRRATHQHTRTGRQIAMIGWL